MTREDIDRALSGDAEAHRVLVSSLIQIVHVAVSRQLRRYEVTRDRDIRQEALDLMHDVIVKLWENDCRELRKYDESRGSLAGFIGNIAVRHVSGVMRTKCRNPYSKLLIGDELLEGLGLGRGLDDQMLAQEYLDRLRTRLEPPDGILTPAMWTIFELHYVEGYKPGEIAAELGTKPANVSSQLNRIRARIREACDQIEVESPSGEMRQPRRV